MRALTACVAMLGLSCAAGASPITPVESGVFLWNYADAGDGPPPSEQLSDINSADNLLDPLSVSGSVTDENGAARVTASGAVSASFDDATHGHVSFDRLGWDFVDVDSGVASHCCLTGWYYTFESDFFGYFHVEGTGTLEGSDLYPELLGFLVGHEGFSPLRADGGMGWFWPSPPFPPPPPPPHDISMSDLRIPIRAGRTYTFAIYNRDFTGGGIPRAIGTRDEFLNGDFTWWIEIVRAPEPGTLGLLGLGLAGLGFMRRRTAA